MVGEHSSPAMQPQAPEGTAWLVMCAHVYQQPTHLPQLSSHFGLGGASCNPAHHCQPHPTLNATCSLAS